MAQTNSYATRGEAARARRKNERTVPYESCANRAKQESGEAPWCLFSHAYTGRNDGPAHPHTCGHTLTRYTNVLRTK